MPVSQHSGLSDGIGLFSHRIADTKDIEISIAILGGTVVLVWVALAVSMWRLTRTLGFALLVAYGAFIAYTLLKPSEC